MPKHEHDFKRFPELTNFQMGLYYFDSPHKQIGEDFFAKVVKVSDGDTIRVETDFRDFSFPIRFSNILAAELNEPGGIESQSWLESQILGEEVTIEVDPKLRVEKWGRLLGKVIWNGLDMGEQSIRQNHSVSGINRNDGRIPDAIIPTE